MTRPEIKDFFPADTDIPIIMEVYNRSPELYQYIQALDSYIDELEDALFEREKTDFRINERRQ